MNILVICEDFIGDTIFATSIADRLKEERPDSNIDFLIRWPQLIYIMSNNPNIRNTYLQLPNTNTYDKVIRVPKVDKSVTPPRQFQLAAGIKNPTDEYKVYLNNTVRCTTCEDILPSIRNRFPKNPIIGIQNDWLDRAFSYTEEEYNRAIDVPHLGYGGRKKDIYNIKHKLNANFSILNLGLGVGESRTSLTASNPETFEQLCMVIKQLDAVVGCEGGIINIAAGLGVKTIVDMSACWMFYGPKGLFNRIPEPKLGPKYYFPNDGHIHLNPYITDDELVSVIEKELL